ncbi:putative 2-oxo-3-deoxygalactonate kinase [Marinomonas sp. MED121]|uniref:2-dehydro-3-deoxygalactonokinase n=1 Tax=Marinomonas sp. MED121 TaxID=314277 RepID=UPI000068FB36|nr:2-dehydro-3-deoxygalactonokinase [Marinomonas sp. MED121]EAQ64985.1 putative 2-oxo-3-deoxygalactonate kinase [Marinomonas sp. MED121]
MSKASQESAREQDYLCIAVDWGTSNLRAYLLDQEGNSLDQRESNKGILNVVPGQFETVLTNLVGDWLQQGLPILMAGMVGSRTGWQEVDYQTCPLSLDSLGEKLHWLETNLECPVAIVPGLQGRGISGCNDIMRGEETQLLGVLDWLQSQQSDEDVLCCMPGTHCKWVRIEQGHIKQFSTTFSGELFANINRDSSLVRGLPSADELDVDAFKLGLATSQQQGGLLHHLFSVRSNYISNELSPEQVRDYLSGVVIGHDVMDMLKAISVQVSTEEKAEKVHLIGSRGLCDRYGIALTSMGVEHLFIEAGEASIRGLKRLAEQNQSRFQTFNQAQSAVTGECTK